MDVADIWHGRGATADDRKLIKMRTTDNPHLPMDFIDRMRSNYDPKTLQAYLNENLRTSQWGKFMTDLAEKSMCAKRLSSN